jgi:uncharacterized protein
MLKPKNSKYIEVRNSPIHGTGIFAACDISKGKKIIEYIGKKISKDEAEKIAETQFEKGEKGSEGHVYIFEVNDDYDLDGNIPENTARFINHSCNPNCETEQDEKDKIWIIALRDIKKGEELSYNYCYDLDSYEEHPCRCGSKNCIGYIVAEKYWGKLEKRKKVTFKL